MSGLDPFGKSFEYLKVSRSEFVAEVTLHRPDARNALNTGLMQELIDLGCAFRLRSDIRAIILTGGPTIFSAGADLGGIKERVASPTILEMREALMIGPDMCKAWEDIEAVTIAAIEGYCIGGGCALALACDFRIMGEGAYLRLPEVPLGINMSWRSVPRIASLVGPSRAKRFIMFGEAADAATCLDWGFADEITAPGNAMVVAKTWAQKISDLPPIPIRMTKEAVNMSVNANHLPTSFMDRDQYIVAAKSNDFREGLNAFLEKRKPNFKGD